MYNDLGIFHFSLLNIDPTLICVKVATSILITGGSKREFVIVVYYLTSICCVSFYTIWVRVKVMASNATFNKILVTSWWSVLLVEETGVPGENHRPAASH